MRPDQFSKLKHDAVHELMRLNESCAEGFRISSWPRWDYDLDRGTLTFSENGVPKVIASIQVIGTTSRSEGTWMWAWANDSLPPNVTKDVRRVREFGRIKNIAELVKPEVPDDEHLGWCMTALAAKLLGAKGAYRCPSEKGFVYLIYSSIGFASDFTAPSDDQLVQCSHGRGFSTYICDHLLANPAQAWFSNKPDEKQPWPDAWCAACEAFFIEQAEWNEKNQRHSNIKVICHHCYEDFRSQAIRS